MKKKKTGTSDAEVSRKVRASLVQCDRLFRLVSFPLHVEVRLAPEPRALDNWELVAPAMLFSASNCLRSVRLLAEVEAPRREQDAMVLLRRLYEHVVDFAWIAIDPEVNVRKWVADDFYHRLKISNELVQLGKQGLPTAKATDFESYVSKHGRMPDMASRADGADKYWSKKIDGHGVYPSKAQPQGRSINDAQNGLWSLRTQYITIYRGGSANAHPTPFSLFSYIGPGDRPGTFRVGVDPAEQDNRYAYTFAPIIYSTMLFVSEQVLGYPKRSDVEAAFDGTA